MKASEMKLQEEARVYAIHRPQKEIKRLKALGVVLDVKIRLITWDPFQTIMIFQVEDTWVAIEKDVADGLEVAYV